MRRVAVHLVALLLVVAASEALVIGSARAEPIVDFPTGAPAGTAVFGLAPGDAGSMWLAESPTGEGDQYEVAEMSSSGTITTSDQLTTEGTQADTAAFVTLVPAVDGGVWALQGESLAHISPTGIVEPITLPSPGPLVYGLASGEDASAWALACHPFPGSEETSETCEALKIEVDGHVVAYPLPAFSRTYPTADEGNGYYVTPPGLTFPVAGGVWMDRPAVTSTGSRIWEAAFVTYEGEVTPAAIPTNARLVAGAEEDNAWWQEPAENGVPTTSTVTFGQLMPDGTSKTVLVHAQEPGEPNDYASIEPGPNGTLLWAERTPSSATHTGLMGTISTAGETRYAVEPLATIVSSEGATWVGGGDFGGLYEAGNGDIWMNSFDVLSVLTPADEFTTFTPLPSTTEQLQIVDMQPSSTGALWFSLNKPNVSSESASGVLARANPLSPPPGLPHFPVSSGSVETPTTGPVPSQPLAVPVLGETQQVRTISGTVSVRLKGTHSFVRLSQAMTIPVGSEVEATRGRALITAATPAGKTVSAEASSGRFVIEQERGNGGRTSLVLSLQLTGCPTAPLPKGTSAAISGRSSKHAGPKSRHLWVSEHGGSWGTDGRYVSTTVEGTHWLTLDECERSEVSVVAGRVKVRNLITDKTKVLTSGQHYIASRRRR